MQVETRRVFHQFLIADCCVDLARQMDTETFAGKQYRYGYFCWLVNDRNYRWN